MFIINADRLTQHRHLLQHLHCGVPHLFHYHQPHRHIDLRHPHSPQQEFHHSLFISYCEGEEEESMAHQTLLPEHERQIQNELTLLPIKILRE
jgi:hypothetical protein